MRRGFVGKRQVQFLLFVQMTQYGVMFEMLEMNQPSESLPRRAGFSCGWQVFSFC